MSVDDGGLVVLSDSKDLQSVVCKDFVSKDNTKRWFSHEDCGSCVLFDSCSRKKRCFEHSSRCVSCGSELIVVHDEGVMGLNPVHGKVAGRIQILVCESEDCVLTCRERVVRRWVN